MAAEGDVPVIPEHVQRHLEVVVVEEEEAEWASVESRNMCRDTWRFWS